MITKEWIKIKWAYLLCFLICISMIANIIIQLNYKLQGNELNTFLFEIVADHKMHFIDFQYIPILCALIISLAQYIPEVLNKRFKLSFRLPISDNTVVLQFLCSGVLFLSIILGLSMAALLTIHYYYFPREVVLAVFFSSAPWFLAAYFVYFMIATISFEPKWKNRILYGIMTYGIIDVYFRAYWYNAYTEHIYVFVILTMLSSLACFYTAQRFRRGL